MNPIYGLSAVTNRVLLGVLFVWGASIPTWGFYYTAYKFRHCRGRFWFCLAQGSALLLFFALAGASLLFPSVFSSDAMQWVPHLSFLALPVTAIVGARLLRRFEARHPEEAERSRRTEEEQFR